MSFLVSCVKWKEFFICPNLLQRLKLSSIELEKFASIVQIKISLASIPLEPSPSSCFPTLSHVLQHTECVHPPSTEYTKACEKRRVWVFGFLFTLVLLEQVSF